MKYFFLVCAIAFSISFTYSQETVNKIIKLSGKVIDAETNQPLEYATIVLQKKNDTIIKGTTTNKKGNFVINITNGIYDIKVDFLSFKTYKIEAKELLKSQNLGVIALKPDNTLDEVEITAQKKLTEIKFNKVVYNASSDIANLGGTGVDVLNNTPTVRVEENGDIIVRGGKSTILVNGKPQFGLNNNTDILKAIPANTIDKVEIISKSAKYSAEGSGAILNIITKKRLGKGFNGSIETHTGLPNDHGFSSFLNLDKDKVNLYSTISYNYSERYKDTDYTQKAFGLDSKNRTDEMINSFLVSVGGDFYITNKDEINTNVLVNLNSKNFNSNFNANEFNRNSYNDGEGSRIEASLGYKRKFNDSGHELSTDFRYDNSLAENNATIRENQIPPIPSIFQQSNKEQNLDNFSAQLDYKLPITEKSILNLGYRSTFRFYDNTFKVEQLNNITGNFDVVNNLDNTINYDELVHAFYGQFDSSLGKVSYTLGLRTEITDIDIDDKLNNDNTDKNYTDFFPSLSLSHEFGEASYLLFSYDRSITRPSIDKISPFIGFADQRFQEVGNLDLNPSYANSFLFLYGTSFGKFDFVTAAFSTLTSDNVLTIFEDTGETTTNGDPIFISNYTNNGNAMNLGIDADLTYRPSKNFRFNLYLSPYHEKTYNTTNGKYDVNNTVFYASADATISLNNGLMFKVNQKYQSRKKFNGLQELAPITFTDLTISKHLFNKKATLAFKALDVFASKKFKLTSTENNTTTIRNSFFQNRFKLSFTYRFNQKRKSSKDRSNDINKDNLYKDRDEKM